MEGRDDEEIDLADDGEGGRLPQIVAGERGGEARGDARAALHPAAAALHRGDAGQAAWRSSASAGPRPTPRSSRRSRSATTSARRRTGSIPEDKGRLVTAFLANYFGRYVDYDFTADLEEELDRVTTGEEDWKALLARFWADFSAALGETEGLRITEVLDKINEVLEPHLFPVTPEDPEPRRCKVCGTGRLSPARPRATGRPSSAARTIPSAATPGRWPATTTASWRRSTARCSARGASAARCSRKRRGGQPVTLQKGPYGSTCSSARRSTGEKPRRVLDPEGDGPGDARPRSGRSQLLSLPRLVGAHPEDGEPVEAGHRPLRAVRQARQDLCQHPRRRGGVHHRHEPGGGAPGAEEPARRPRRGGEAAARARRASRRRRGRGLCRPLRALREVGEGQRDPTEGNRPRGGDARAGARADRRQGPGGEEAGRQETGSEKAGGEESRRPKAPARAKRAAPA